MPASPSSRRCRSLARPAARLVQRFGEADAQAIKDIEKTTNHDVKAVEYWIKRASRATPN
jgi:adenylosuccinate lyase